MRWVEVMPSFGGASRLGRLRAILSMVALAIGALLFAGESAAQGGGTSDLSKILGNVEAHSQVPEHIRMHQSVTVRALIFTWKFNSILEYVGDELTSTTEGAPSFVPESFPVDLVSLGQTLPLFDLKLISERNDQGYIVLGGPRPDFDGQGAEEATFMIDPRDWLVKRASAKYAWGTLTVDQEFGSFQGLMLLRRQRATVKPHGLVVDVEYSNYSFVETAQSIP